MTLINDAVRDGLSASLTSFYYEVWLCSGAESLVFATLSAQKMATKTSVVPTGPANRAGGGREITIPAVSNGSVTASGTATLQAIVDVYNSRVLAVTSLAAPIVLTNGTKFTLGSWKVGIP